MATQPPTAAKKNMVAKAHGSRLPLATLPMDSRPRDSRSGANGLIPGSNMKMASRARVGPATAPGMKYIVRIPAPMRS